MRSRSVLVAAVLAVAGTVLPWGSTAATAAERPACRNGDVVVGYHARDAATSHRYGVLVVRNTSNRTCTVRGYGGLSYVGHGNGTQVGAAATRNGAKARTVVLEPGDRARSRVSEAVAQAYPQDECRPLRVDGFRVYVPGATRSQFVQHRTTGCADDDVTLISHGPFRAARR